MVAEELARIVQSELVELRQRNIAEATTRVRLENQLGELKVVKIAHIVLLIVLYIMCLYVSVHPCMCLCVCLVCYVELSSAHKELQKKEERVTELEETLKGTSFLVIVLDTFESHCSQRVSHENSAKVVLTTLKLRYRDENLSFVL